MDAPPLEVLLMSSLRVLVVLPMYGGSLPIGQYCAHALRKLGHSVRVFEAQKLYPGYTGVKDLDMAPKRVSAMENAFLRFVGQALLSMAEEQEPQLVIAMAQAPLDRNLLGRFRQRGIPTVMWFVEDFRIFTYWRAYAPLYDAFAVIQKEPFLKELAACGQKHAFYLPLAASPDIHKPLKLSSAENKEYGSDISFLGAGYPNRRLAFRPLAGKNFKIWGSDWDGEGLLAKNIQRNGARIAPEESIKIYNAAKVNLNLHSSMNAEKIVGNGDFVNPRTFELAAMGAFQLVDQRSLMDELFAPGELATFTDMDGFYGGIDHFLSHPDERREYARKARERTLADHTYEKRMATLVEYMSKNFGPLGQEQKGGVSLAGMETEMAEKLRDLASDLGLSPTADFADIVARLRQKSGVLNELETGILFLDEWRKQYGK